MSKDITKRITAWLFLTCSFISCVQSGVFIHAVMVDGKPQIVSTVLNSSTSLLPSNTHRRHKKGSLTAQFEIPLSTADEKWLGSLLRLPEKGDVRIRKEYRQLSEMERNELHLAFNLLKKDKSVSLNKYDLLANIHARSSANRNAHKGPNFLGWHRVFLLMMENALRQKVKTVTLPYWDVTLDEAMEYPYKSVIWSDSFMGDGEGLVKTGSFKNWQTHFGFGHLRRMLSGQGKLMSKTDVENILSKSYIGEITNPNANITFNMEEIHNDVHVWIGGQMKTIEIAAFDPIFYLLHAFTDQIWSDFRTKQKLEGIDPTSDYPEYYGLPTHSPFAPMALGEVMVLDGISDIWNEHVKYTPRPTCNKTFNGCYSIFLKCDIQRKRCVSKNISEMTHKPKPRSYKRINNNTSAESDTTLKYSISTSKTNDTDSTEILYIKPSQLSNLSNPTMYDFQTMKSNSSICSLHETVQISEVYQFYSVLSSDQPDIINFTLFFIYIHVFHLQSEHH